MAAITGFALVIVGLLPLILARSGEPPYTPSATPPEVDEPTGLTGLAPEGATPSAPQSGELVASMWEHAGASGSFGNGWLYLYTSEGVEAIRSEIIASGLFDPDQPSPEPNNGFPREISGGRLQVRNGDRLVYINHVVPELFGRMAGLWSWLPDAAWDDQEPKPYVPSRYAVCVHSGGYTKPTNVSEHLSALPGPAQDLLADARRLFMADLVEVDPAAFESADDSSEFCFDITAEEARTLTMTLDDLGVELLPSSDGFGVTYVISRGDDGDFTGPGFNGVTIALWPILPHGVPAFTGA